MVLAQASKKFGVLPSERLGLKDRALALDFDNACALRLILLTGDLETADDEEMEDVPLTAGPAEKPKGARRRRGGSQRDVTIEY